MNDTTVTVLGKLESWPHAIHVTKTGGELGSVERHYAISEATPDDAIRNPKIALLIALGITEIPEDAERETLIFTICPEDLKPIDLIFDMMQEYNSHWNGRTTEDQLNEVYHNDLL